MRTGYVGTAAHGRSSTFRYYTCWSRVRYGTAAGCDIHRFNADTIETAITTALLDFYHDPGDVIDKAVAEYQSRHGTDNDRRRSELDAVTREMKDNSAAIDRYLIAFEKGTLDVEDSVIRDRLATLKTQSRALRTRQAQLEFELERPPQALTVADRAAIRDILTTGTAKARKAMCDAPHPRNPDHR